MENDLSLVDTISIILCCVILFGMVIATPIWMMVLRIIHWKKEKKEKKTPIS